MKLDGRKAPRVRMDHKQPVNLMGSDGTWRRSCVLLDISQTGAKLEGTLDVLRAKEFFMLLSSDPDQFAASVGQPRRRNRGRRALRQRGRQEEAGQRTDRTKLRSEQIGSKIHQAH
ncbi:hypothetical protein ACVWXO_007703 [Bradyrhizobium sp. LM2.7]